MMILELNQMKKKMMTKIQMINIKRKILKKSTKQKGKK